MKRDFLKELTEIRHNLENGNVLEGNCEKLYEIEDYILYLQAIVSAYDNAEKTKQSYMNRIEKM